jgi:lipoprotein-releasing system permease protein
VTLPRIDVLLVCGVATLFVAMFMARVVRALRAGPMKRAVVPSIAMVFGLLFIGLTLYVAVVESRTPVGPACATQPFSLLDFIARTVALGSGVWFLIFVLHAALPLVLNLVEKRGFVPFVAVRQFRAAKSGFLTVISVLSILGVAFSSCALCTVTSVMGGFGADLKQKILANGAHLQIEAPTPDGFDDVTNKLDAVRIAVAPFGGAATPVIAGDVMGSSTSNTAGVLLRGIDPESIAQVINLKKTLEVGRFEYLEDPTQLTRLKKDEIIGCSPAGEPYFRGPDLRDFGGPRDPEDGISEFLRARTAPRPGVILGKEVAKSLHVLVGDEVTLLSPMGELGPMGVMPKTRRFRVAAIFYTGHYEVDATHGYVLLADAAELLGMGERVSEIDVRVPDPEKVDEIRGPVEAAMAKVALPGEAPPKLRDWKEVNRSLFSALKLERLGTFVILCITIAVASFCIVCTLLLMVTEKSRQIAVLKAMGGADRQIAFVFVVQGVLIGGIGTTLGVLVAAANAAGLAWFGVRLDPEVYYITRLPVNVDPVDYLLVALASMVICSTATILPSLFAARQPPLDGIRHE